MEAVDWPFSSRRSAGAGTEADLRTLGERRPRPPPSVAHSCKVSPAGAAVEQACRDYCSDPPTTPLAVTRITPTRGGGGRTQRAPGGRIRPRQPAGRSLLVVPGSGHAGAPATRRSGGCVKEGPSAVSVRRWGRRGPPTPRPSGVGRSRLGPERAVCGRPAPELNYCQCRHHSTPTRCSLGGAGLNQSAMQLERVIQSTAPRARVPGTVAQGPSSVCLRPSAAPRLGGGHGVVRQHLSRG